MRAPRLLRDSARCVAALLGAVLFARADQVDAQSAEVRSSIPVRIVYQAVAGCPSAEQMFAEVSRRTRLVRRAVGDEPARTFQVEVTTDGTAGASRSEAIVRESTGKGEMERRLIGRSCDEATDAAAFVVAVLADPSVAAPPDEGAPLPPPPMPPPLSGGGSVAPPDPAWPSNLRSSATPPTTSAGHGWQAGAGYAAIVVLGAAPGATPGIRAFIEAGRQAAPFVFVPWLRASAALARSATLATSVGLAQLAWRTARVDVCAHGDVGQGWSLTPCAAFEMGTLVGTGFRTRSPRNATVTWLAPAALGRFGWGVVGPLALEAELGLSFPLSPPEFYFDAPNGVRATLHRVPQVIGHFALGMAVHFP
jgi:hypothetical protein